MVGAATDAAAGYRYRRTAADVGAAPLPPLRPDPTQAGGTPTPTVAQQVETAVAATVTAVVDSGAGGAGGDNGGGSGSETPGAGDGSGGSGGEGAPRIVRYELEAGADGTVQVTWEVTGATKITLNEQNVPATGTQTVDTTTDQSLTLTASNDEGDVVSQSKGVLIMRPPEIKSFTAEPAQTCPRLPGDAQLEHGAR